MDVTVKAGFALELSELKQENLNSGWKVEDDVRALSVRSKKKNWSTICTKTEMDTGQEHVHFPHFPFVDKTMSTNCNFATELLLGQCSQWASSSIYRLIVTVGLLFLLLLKSIVQRSFMIMHVNWDFYVFPEESSDSIGNILLFCCFIDCDCDFWSTEGRTHSRVSTSAQS